MSQSIHSNINPAQTTGLMLIGILEGFKDAIVSGFSGTSRPSGLQAGGYWVDTTNEGSPNYYLSLKLYTGTVDIEMSRASLVGESAGPSGAIGSFEVAKTSADAVGPIVNLFKSRVTGAGQTLSGDDVGTLTFTGKTSSGAITPIGFIIAEATENFTDTNIGVSLSLMATPFDEASTVSYWSLVGGLVESVLPNIVNSLRIDTDLVTVVNGGMELTGAVMITDLQLSGVIAPTINGIAADENTLIKIIINSCGQIATLKHDNAGTAAADRLLLPRDRDMYIPAGGSCSFFQCSTGGWKPFLGAISYIPEAAQDFRGGYAEYTPPRDGRVRVKLYSHSNFYHPTTDTLFTRDSFGSLFAAGSNINGELGDGSVVAKSSPVAVLGGQVFEHYCHTVAVSTSGDLYSWGDGYGGGVGDNTILSKSSPVLIKTNMAFPFQPLDNPNLKFAINGRGQLFSWGITSSSNGMYGTGVLTPSSTPVAVSGDHKFAHISVPPNGSRVLAVRRDGLAYGWGINGDGALGNGTLVNASAPSAVVGSNKFRKIVTGQTSTIGLKTDGSLLAWGYNDKGQLGIGSVVNTSSPVAVLTPSGVTFIDILSVYSDSGIGDATFALASDGTLYSWGDGGGGLLGSGSVASRSSPVAVLGSTKFVSIYAKDQTIFGLTQGGDLYGWGATTPSGTPASSPTLWSGGLNIVGVIVESNAALLVTPSGPYHQGYGNAGGKSGTGDLTNPHPTPVKLLGGPSQWQINSLIKTIEFEVLAGTTYKIILGHGDCFWQEQKIGSTFGRAVVEFIE